MTLTPAPTALLDLDGTLVDSVPDIAASLNRLMASVAQPPFTHPEVAAFVGDGVPTLIARACAARGLAPTEAFTTIFLADYTPNSARLTRPYPGIIAMLEALRRDGWTLALCTNKPEAAARTLLSGLGLLSLFACIGAGDSFAVRKPDPGHLLATLALVGGNPDRAVMLGDHAHDITAARAAGVAPVFAAWGYGAPGADLGAPRIDSPAAFPPLARRLLSPLGAGGPSPAA